MTAAAALGLAFALNAPAARAAPAAGVDGALPAATSGEAGPAAAAPPASEGPGGPVVPVVPSPARCADGPLSREGGLVVNRAGTLCAGEQLLVSTDGLLVGGAAALSEKAQIGVTGLIPINEEWPALVLATGELGVLERPRLRASARATIGYARLASRDRSAGLIGGGLGLSWRPEERGGAMREALAQRAGLHAGVSAWTGAGQPLGTVVDLSRGGALVGEAGLDLLLGRSLVWTTEIIVPTIVFDGRASAGELAAVAYGLRGMSERLRVDVGFVKGTGAAGQLDALRLGFPLIRISGLVRVSDEAAARKAAPAGARATADGPGAAR